MKNIFENLTVVIVSFNSDYYLNIQLKKLKKFKVIVVENSNNKFLKTKIEKKYKNVNLILSGSNIGFGSAVNLAIRKSSSKFYLIINPDCEFNIKTIYELYTTINNNRNISVISPSITRDKKNRYTNRYGYFISTLFKKQYFENSLLKQVDFIIGHFFIISENTFKKIGMFDQNIFLGYDEIDLQKRMQKNNLKVFVHKKTSVKHLEMMSALPKNENSKFFHEIIKCHKWHLAWSKFYYYKKNYNYLISFVINTIFIIKNLIKFLYFFIKGEEEKKEISLSFIKGSLSSFLNKKSFYRPKI